MKSLGLRLIAALILGITFVSVASSWYEMQGVKDALRNELERKAETFTESLAGNAQSLLAAGDRAGMEQLVERFGNRGSLLGVGIIDRDHSPLAVTHGISSLLPGAMPPLKHAIQQDKEESGYMRLRFRRVFLMAVPLHAADGSVFGGMVLIYDTAYIRAEIFRLWIRVFIHVALQVLVIAAITFLIVRMSLVRPIARVAYWIRDLRAGRHPLAPSVNDLDILFPLAQEVVPLLASIHQARAAAAEEARLRNSKDPLWTSQRLAAHVRSKLDGNSLYVVSNREPYVHNRVGNHIAITVPASGLVTALEPVLCACDGTWVAHGSGDADVATVDGHDRLRVPPQEPRYTLRRVWLSPEEENGYYYGFANEGLWPLCHIAHTRPIFRATDWEHYINVNKKFADALVEEIGDEEHPVVLIQDYHFALVPRTIKERLPQAKVAIFWHIPWPNPESFGICPWQRELLDGLLGADLIGFHVQAHCNNFLDTVDRVLEARVDWEHFSVKRNGHWSSIRPFPISVDFQSEVYSVGAAVDADAERRALMAELGTEASVLGLGVDRMDYTKGILERFQAVEMFLEDFPDYQGKFTFIQIGAPSRSHIQRYSDLQVEIEAEANRINARFQHGRWRPVLLLKQQHDHDDLQRFYRAAHVCMVTSLHDGMNLVAKEYVAARRDEQGVLILSRFTGAARELLDALIVNPYDIQSMSASIARALAMDKDEITDRMRRMRAWVKEHNIYWWAGSLIGELCDLRMKGPEAKTASSPEDHPLEVEF
ncbi:MAG: alpha,alpha-trehalose-phosphate synthase (UDP-forming) [Acidobacteriaceae bacterium]